ncbi:MAG TPA: bifunctional diaminohydroxyphosphoribosylaminopyrimidine deaminase/5-amino-6-(5-phosphoribosylamino)uracil reductase RibD [Flavobacteriales bacterium]
MDHTRWMHRCLQLARNASGRTAPNPMVGAVLVQGARVLAEGWHHRAGAPHAEADLFRRSGDAPVPSDAILYVNLEPCAHHGRTPPCADLLIARGVRHVVIGLRDPDPRVCGKGIERLRAAGVQVTLGVAEEECAWEQRRFLSGFRQQRPYVMLKWARSADGFLDRHPRDGRLVQRISSPATDVSVHRWRSEEQAILVGSRTVINDDPQLSVRHVSGPSPLRIVIDRQGVVPADSRIFDTSAPTLLVTSARRSDVHCEQIPLTGPADPIDVVLNELHQRQVRSLLVEGGAELLGHFIRSDRWDEARVITGTAHFAQGTPAPQLPRPAQRSFASGTDRIHFFTRTVAVDPTWYW